TEARDAKLLIEEARVAEMIRIIFENKAKKAAENLIAVEKEAKEAGWTPDANEKYKLYKEADERAKKDIIVAEEDAKEAKEALEKARIKAKQDANKTAVVGNLVDKLAILSPIQPPPKSGFFSDKKEINSYKDYQKRYDNTSKIIKIFNKYTKGYNAFIKNNINIFPLQQSLTNLRDILDEKDKDLINKVKGYLRDNNINEGKESLKILNLSLNRIIIPNLNKAIEIFNGSGTKFFDKLEAIKANGGLAMTDKDVKDIDMRGGGNTTRSKGNRSNRKTMKIRFIY
ncbi:MAG: hypothetical protein EB127_13635, partial [Alphaproteobacteria bacterium]|nr:hypothetical protein [Alphaproteobacteria bacterium]